MTGFIGRYDNFISQQQIGGDFTLANPAIFQVINLSRVDIEGIEARFGLAFPGGFNADAAIAYADGDVTDPVAGNGPLSSIDPLKIVLGAGWRDPRGRFGFQLYLTATERKEAGEQQISCPFATGTTRLNCYRPPASTVIDATAFWRIGENFTIRAGLFNITDERYAVWGDVAGLAATSTVTDAYTQPGRNARVSLTVRF